MSAAIRELESRLRTFAAGGDSHARLWTDPTNAMHKVLMQVRKDHDGAAIHNIDLHTIEASVQDFLRTGQVANFRELKYVCWGVSYILDKPQQHYRNLLSLVENKEHSPHQQLKCFQALLSAYLRFPYTELQGEKAQGWLQLRDWLQAQQKNLAQQFQPQKSWFMVLERHLNLLSAQPCERYGEGLLDGDNILLNDATEGLGIPLDSWVMDKAILAHIHAAMQQGDADFAKKLPALLDTALGKSIEKISDLLKKECVALLVGRYAASASHPEHPALRDAAVEVIGNPWLQRVAWDAAVRKNGQPDDAAREMVFGWLKRTLITDFFQLLSYEGTTDKRRLNYWLKYVDQVEDMWFALGRSAKDNNTMPFREFRRRARGRLLNLKGGTSRNNAFIMRIRNHLLIEFGAQGEGAFYLLNFQQLEKKLTQSSQDIEIELLKPQIEHILKLIHNGEWEDRFNQRLAKNGLYPKTTAPLSSEFRIELERYKIRMNDLRPRGGAFWVEYYHDNGLELAAKFKSEGFTFHAGRGWYKE